MASFEHVQERELASSLECAVMHAVDGIWNQRCRVELGRFSELNVGNDGLHASGVANPVCMRGQKKERREHGSDNKIERREFLPASPAQMRT